MDSWSSFFKKQLLLARPGFLARNNFATKAWLGTLSIGAAALLLSCENDLSKVNTITSELFEVSVETSRGIRIVYSDSAKVKAVMTSPLLMSYHTEEPYDLMPEGLLVKFYNDSLQVESTMASKYGRRDLKNKTMEVKDSVVVVTTDGRRLETERLVWEEENDRIFSDRFVKIIHPNGDVNQGIGLETNSKFSPYKIIKFTGDLTQNTGGSADSLSRPDSLNAADSTAVPAAPNVPNAGDSLKARPEAKVPAGADSVDVDL